MYHIAVIRICIPNGLRIYQPSPFQDPTKFTQIKIFGLKIYHLATLIWDTFFARKTKNKENEKSQFGSPGGGVYVPSRHRLRQLNRDRAFESRHGF
jgi:hypothetical protein